MNPAIGLVIALKAEATALLGHGRWQHVEGHLLRRSRLTNSTHLVVVRSGIGMEDARLASQRLIAEGVVALGVSGVSGGLDPDLKPGDLVLADSVIQENGNTREQTWEGNSKFVDIAYAALIAKGIPAYHGPIITVQKPVLSARNKQALFTISNALAADMESAAVAAVANKAGLPFFAVRAVCDAATRSISDDLFDCLDQGGQVRLFHLFQRLLLKPALVSDLLRMKRDFAAALTSLRHAWNMPIRDSLPFLFSSGEGLYHEQKSRSLN